MWLSLFMALFFAGAFIWHIISEEMDHADYMRAMRAEREREGMRWLALLEEREEEQELDDYFEDLLAQEESHDTVLWKKEGF